MVVISLYLHQVKKVRKNLVVIAYELSKEYPHEREAGQYWQIAILLTFCATTRFLPASLSKKKTSTFSFLANCCNISQKYNLLG